MNKFLPKKKVKTAQCEIEYTQKLQVSSSPRLKSISPSPPPPAIPDDDDD